MQRNLSGRFLGEKWIIAAAVGRELWSQRRVRERLAGREHTEKMNPHNNWLGK